MALSLAKVRKEFTHSLSSQKMEGVLTPSFFILMNSQTILNLAPDPWNGSIEIQVRAGSIVRIFVQHTRANCQNISNFQNKLFSLKRKICLDFSAPTWYNIFGGTIFKLLEFSDYSELSEHLKFSNYSEFAAGVKFSRELRRHVGSCKTAAALGSCKRSCAFINSFRGSSSQNLTKIFKFSGSCVWKFDRKNQIFKIKLKELQNLILKVKFCGALPLELHLVYSIHGADFPASRNLRNPENPGIIYM